MPNYIDPIYEEKDIQIVTDIVYSNEPLLAFDLYTPSLEDYEARPIVVFLHGGGGDKADGRGWSLTWATRGYMAVSANFRNAIGNYNHKEQMLASSNILALIGYLRMVYGNRKILLMGVSEGGITAVQTAIIADEAQKDMAGFFKGYDYNQANGGHRVAVSASATLPGAATDDFIVFVEKHDKPVYMFHGKQDKTLPFKQAQKTYDAFIAAGIKATLNDVEDPSVFDNATHKLEGCGDQIHASLIPKFAALVVTN